MGARRIGIVTDKGLVNAGVVDMVKDVLDVQRSPVVAGVYDKVKSTPSLPSLMTASAGAEKWVWRDCWR